MAVRDLDTLTPVVAFRTAADEYELRCDFVAGCDGSHGVCLPSVPANRVQIYERIYPLAWLGILVNAAPSSEELVYSLHERGFALFSMRSPQVTRLYLQCAPDEDLDQWPDARIWSELTTRLHTSDGWSPNPGPITQQSVARMRSVVVEPMNYGRLFLAGDAAHTVPPTGAKGLNLAMADVWRLAGGLASFYSSGSDAELSSYSARGLRRTWRAQRFSAWMTSALHRSATDTAFDQRRQLADPNTCRSSRGDDEFGGELRRPAARLIFLLTSGSGTVVAAYTGMRRVDVDTRPR